jgi:CDP-diacylglycerol--glycerol-3-phosphate 3-phosphatidyltransferase
MILVNKMKKYIPNIITTARLVLACIFPIAFMFDLNIAIIIFIVASFSDSIDGFLARKWDVVSEYGKNIDPIADKLLVGAALVLAANFIDSYLVIPLILEVLIATLNVLLYKKSNLVKVTKWGKIKAVILYPMIAIGLLTYIYGNLKMIFYTLLITTIVLQFITIASYLIQHKEIKKNYA